MSSYKTLLEIVNIIYIYGITIQFEDREYLGYKTYIQPIISITLYLISLEIYNFLKQNFSLAP